MAPKPDEFSSPKEVGDDNFGERVVISGIAGLYPSSPHIKKFSDILYNKINPINDENPRWKYDHPEVAQYTGKVPGLALFDAQFFKVHYRMGNNMDPMSRKILEQSYHAIYDAGISPEELSGKKVGVYIGSCFSETEKACFYDTTSKTGFGIAGCSKTMFANRISYWLNAKGPSLSIDDMCCSSTTALEQALQAIKRGECEAAIVGGVNLSLHPQPSVHYGRIIKLSMNGETRSFDTNASGCARSEAVNVIFLQKAKHALRIYAEVVHVKCEFTSLLEGELGPNYGFCRDPLHLSSFLEQFYKEARVSPSEVEYVEAFGAAVPESDKIELEAIDNVFCKSRRDPLLVGSVMSNIGYTEAASGVSAITKILLGYQKGELAANLNCDSPRKDVAGIRDGRIQIVTDHQKFGRSYTAVNGLSVTGLNSHVLLYGHYKPKDPSRYKSNIPYLVTISARQESSVENIIAQLKSNPVDPEEISLLHNIHKNRISGHLGRGFAILDRDENNETVCLTSKASYFDDAKRPLWFVYSGMGSQWAGMGTQLMRIPIFAAAIERCHRVLEPKGIDIVQIITSPDKTTFDNILNSFVGIAAVQIGLTDILRELGIVPDKIIGHSVGELGCAYADGCFTAEEMILAAYSRGLVSVQTPFIRGSMAAVGIGYQQVSKMCPPEIEVACHNGPDSSTISGPAEIMKEFVAELTKNDIFAKEVPCSNIAYHSRYIAEAGPGLLKYLKEVIPNPKLRSERWVSTSVPQDKWDEPEAKYSSAEYHTNNLLNSVLFEETSKLIPSNAVVVEIAPHGLLQAILKRSLSESCKHIPLTRRGHPDNAKFLLEAIGNLYMEGYNPTVQALYPQVEFPVSTETPHLSHLVEWAHQERWSVPLYVAAHRRTSALYKPVLSTYDDEHSFLKGHIIGDKNIYPISGILISVWDTLAMLLNVGKKQLSVEFKDVYIHSLIIICNDKPVKFNISIQRGTGRFEVNNEGITIASGYIKSEISPVNIPGEQSKDGIINSNDIYQLLHAKGYNYQNKFRSIQNIDQSLTEGQIIWTNNWITFIDALIQMNLLRRSGDTLSYPNYIKRITIDINHLNKNSSSFANAQLSEVFNSTSCGGVVIEHMQYEDVPQNNKIALNALTFIPHYTTDTIDEETALYSLLQMVAENLNEDVVNILEVSEHSESVSKIEKFIKIADTITGLKIDFSTIQRCTMMDESNRFETNIGLLLVNNLSSDDSMCQKLDQILKHNAFIINKEIDVEKISAQRPSAMYQIISAHTFGNMRLELSIWRPTNASSSTSAFSVMSTSDLPSLVSSIPILPPRQRIIILTPYPPVSGLTNLIKEWRTRDNRDINLVIVNHKIHEEQNLDQMSFTNLAVNILDQGVWGGEYFLPIKNETVKGVEKALEIKHLGDLDSLHWVKVPEPSNPGIPIKIHYAGINKSEVKTKLDKQSCKQGSSQSRLLFDFSGKTDSGVSVMGVAQEESLKTRVKTNLELLWPVPKHWNLEDAATVPLAYTIAFYCLCIKSRLYRGNSILVNGGAGALGQAIISIALHLGCEVFTTVSDTSKKQFLLKLFPELKEENITNSRDNCFSDVILDNTKGLGCNMVITCCKGVHKMEAIKCCAMSGVVIDTSLITDHEDFQFGMKNLVKSLSYHSISISSLFEDRNIEELKRIQHMISEGIAQGYVRPLTRVTFPLSEVSRAYHFHTSNRNRGRILLNMQEDVQCLQTKIYCKPDLYHLLVSADQILGIEFAERLVNRGARKLILYFTSQSSCLQFKLRSWEKQGVEIKICDAKEFNNITDNIKIVQNLEGIYFIDVSDADVEKINKQVEHINLRSQLRYFAEIRTRIESFGTTGALSTPTKVPKTRVILPLKDAKVESPLTIRDAVNAVELALCSKHRVVLGQISNEEPPASLIKDINLIANIEIPNDINGKATLGNLGMSHFKCEAVKNLLLKDYNTSIDEENILSLTIDSLRDIARKHKKIEVQSSIGGLSTFFSTVDPDELLATTEMVFLQTLSGSSALGMDEFDVNQSFLCVIPGVEGHHERFRSICERLKLPALVLQPPMHKMESDQEMAARFADILLTKTRLTDRFYLLGYERGVMVALEMAAILESKGLTGTVFCLGGTPEEVQRKFEEELGYLNTTESLQKEVLQYMGSLISSVALEVLNPILVKNLTWDEKLNSFVQQLLSSMSLSTQYAKEIILSAYNGINQVRNYKSDLKPLRSSIIYVRPQDVTPKTNTKVYSEKPTIDYTLKSPLKYACNDLLCSAIINRHLDEDVLNKFETESLLETYIADSVSFMTNDKLLTSPCD